MFRNQFSFIVRTYLTGLTMPLSNTRRTQIYKLTTNNKYTNLYNIQLIQENTIQYNSRTNADTLQKDTTTVCSAPGPVLDLGSSLLALTVVVALALGTSSPRPGRTPLTRQPPAFLRTGSSVELSSTHRLNKDGHPRYQSVLNLDLRHTRSVAFHS